MPKTADAPSFATLSPRAVLWAGVIAVGVIGFAGINPHLPGGGDNAGYIAEAESLLTLGRRASIYQDGAPPATLKPPLFPVLLAGVEAVFGRSVVAMKALLVLFAMAAVWAANWTLRAGLDEGGAMNLATTNDGEMTAACGAFWFALLPALALHTHDVLSDVPFAFVAILAFGVAGRIGRATTQESLSGSRTGNGGNQPPPLLVTHTLVDKPPVAQTAALVGLIVLAMLLRAAGALIGAACAGYLLLEWLLRRKEKFALRFLGAGAAVIAITLALVLFQQRGEQGYLERTAGGAAANSASADEAKFSDPNLAARIRRTASFYVVFMSAEVGGYEMLGPHDAVWALAAIGCLVGGLGMVTLLRRGQRLIPVCFAGYHALLLVVPWVDRRYFLPTLPLLACLFWTGGQQIFGWLKGKSPGIAALVVFELGTIPSVSLMATLLAFGKSEMEGTTVVEWVAGPLALAGFLAWAVWSGGVAGTSRRAALALAGVVLALAACRGVSENVARPRLAGPAPAGPGWADFHAAAVWLKEHAKPGEPVASDRMGLVWVWSGLPGVPIPRTRDLAVAEQKLAPARWAIVDYLGEQQIAQRFLLPVLEKQKAQWEVRWRSEGGTWVLRRKNE